MLSLPSSSVRIRKGRVAARIVRAPAAAVLVLTLALACSKDAPMPTPPEPDAGVPSERALVPLRAPRGLDPKRVALGAELFGEARLSGDGRTACSSCHDLQRAGVDGLAHSRGPTDHPSGLNAPTVFNAGLNFRQFWDGRASSLEEQIDGPLLDPDEMASSWERVIATLRADAHFAALFDGAYADGLKRGNVRDAIATFERSLATPDSPLDRYLQGDTGAMGTHAARGFVLFTSYGCSACHQGEAVGGNMFEKLGVMDDYFRDRGHGLEADLGRFNVTHDDADRHVFKVPSLRNVARTAPYFHDGSVATLGEAVSLMARYQLGRDLDDTDRSDLVAFLESLTGSYQGRPL